MGEAQVDQPLAPLEAPGAQHVIDYDRNNWWVTCFAWRGTVLPHVLARVGLLTSFCLVVYLFDDLALRALTNSIRIPDVMNRFALGLKKNALKFAR